MVALGCINKDDSLIINWLMINSCGENYNEKNNGCIRLHRQRWFINVGTDNFGKKILLTCDAGWCVRLLILILTLLHTYHKKIIFFISNLHLIVFMDFIKNCEYHTEPEQN